MFDRGSLQTSYSGWLLVAVLAFWPAPAMAADQTQPAHVLLKSIGTTPGLYVVLGDPQGTLTLALARGSEGKFFVQSAKPDDVATIRKAAADAGLLGTRIFVGQGDCDHLHPAENLADAVIVGEGVAAPKDELLRILRPGGKAILKGGNQLVKPFPAGTDEWSHPYHGPDNNPVSSDQRARRPYLTHFLAEPWYCPLPEMTVISGGRIFKVFGDRSSAKPQEPLLNALLAMNAFNGAILWQRELPPGLMIHRNTFIATPDTLFLADNKSCKLIDPATGKVRDEIEPTGDQIDGPVWKWMALEGGVLYALLGEKEVPDEALRGDRVRGAGWPWWKINKYTFGFGRTLLAIDPTTKKILWRHREQELIDGRGTCMKNGRIYCFSRGKHLACLDAKSGKVEWKNSDKTLLDAIGEDGQAQHWMLGFASTAYLKCSEDALYFAGPQRPRLVAASTKDGKLLWQHSAGNVQLILRPEGVYALGEGRTNSAPSSLKFEPLTGKVLATFPSRDRCTRATGCLDSIFTRGGKGGSTAVFDLNAKEPKMGTIAPMRPACQDGVVAAHGHFFWGPWMCRCDLTQLGVISLAPGGSFPYLAQADEKDRLERGAEDEKVDFPELTTDDWPAYRKDNARSTSTPVAIATEVVKSWEFKPRAGMMPTAPVTAAGLVLLAGSDGIVRALDAETGKPRWTAYVGGSMKYPPAIWNGRTYVGGGDGWIYCFSSASGKLLWRFRAAPVERLIPVYGSLSSTWPIGSGVLVDKGVVYAAAGISSLDGTHVFALDALTGKIRWQNHSSAYNDGDVPDWGVSVQGHLLLHDAAVYLASGNQPTVASYTVADGKFKAQGGGRGKDLFVRRNQVQATGFPLYWRPEDDQFLSPLELETPTGVLSVNTAKLAMLPAKGDPAKPLWTSTPAQEIAAVALTKNAVLVTGLDRPNKQNPQQTESALYALNPMDGKVLWKQALPGSPTLWGLAVDRTGRILVTLTDGRILGFAGK